MLVLQRGIPLNIKPDILLEPEPDLLQVYTGSVPIDDGNLCCCNEH